VISLKKTEIREAVRVGIVLGGVSLAVLLILYLALKPRP
jgi:hypothetical protein